MLTENDAEEFIKEEKYFYINGTTVVVCCLILLNNYVIVEKSCDVKHYQKQNYREEARNDSRRKAILKILEFQAYLIKEKIYQQSIGNNNGIN